MSFDTFIFMATFSTVTSNETAVSYPSRGTILGKKDLHHYLEFDNEFRMPTKRETHFIADFNAIVISIDCQILKKCISMYNGITQV